MSVFFHIGLFPFLRSSFLHPREALTEVQTPSNIHMVVLSTGKPHVLKDHIASWAQMKRVSAPNSLW